MSEQVKVSKEVLKGLEAIRESGLTNMFDFNTVQRLALENKFYDTVVWMQQNQSLYSKGIFNGFEVGVLNDKK